MLQMQRGRRTSLDFKPGFRSRRCPPWREGNGACGTGIYKYLSVKVDCGGRARASEAVTRIVALDRACRG
jgi:hypothetical protein